MTVFMCPVCAHSRDRHNTAGCQDCQCGQRGPRRAPASTRAARTAAGIAILAGARPLTLAERMNPGYVQQVAELTDFDGARFEIAADYNTVKIGPYRIARDRMPELWAALGEAAWQAGVNERTMGEDQA